MDYGCVLEEQNRRRVIERLKNNEDEAEGSWPREGMRDSAVLVPLLKVDGEPSVLFQVRARNLSRHRNQVSFPGGMADMGDDSPVGTALREAQEELGIEPGRVDVWGKLHCFPDRQRTSLVTPVIGCLGSMKLDTLRLSSSEVASVFTLPIARLSQPSIQRYTRFRPLSSLRFPVFLGGPRRVWGITAFILDMALMHVLPEHFNYVPIAARRNYASK